MGNSESASEEPISNSVATEGRSSETKANPVENTAAVKFPHDYEAILRDGNAPFDKSLPSDKLVQHLYDGVALNQMRKKYWVDKNSNSNCFMLFARDLSITWSENNRFWRWPYLMETGDTFIDVAELLDVCWLEVHGRFDTKKLTPATLYEVTFVVMLKDPAYGWEVPVNFRLLLPNGTKQHHKEPLMEKPRGRWIEIPAGEFTTSPETAGEIEFSMFEYEGGKWKKGLIIKGVIIRPKN